MTLSEHINLQDIAQDKRGNPHFFLFPHENI